MMSVQNNAPHRIGNNIRQQRNAIRALLNDSNFGEKLGLPSSVPEDSGSQVEPDAHSSIASNTSLSQFENMTEFHDSRAHFEDPQKLSDLELRQYLLGSYFHALKLSKTQLKAHTVDLRTVFSASAPGNISVPFSNASLDGLRSLEEHVYLNIDEKMKGVIDMRRTASLADVYRELNQVLAGATWDDFLAAKSGSCDPIVPRYPSESHEEFLKRFELYLRNIYPLEYLNSRGLIKATIYRTWVYATVKNYAPELERCYEDLRKFETQNSWTSFDMFLQTVKSYPYLLPPKSKRTAANAGSNTRGGSNKQLEAVPPDRVNIRIFVTGHVIMP